MPCATAPLHLAVDHQRIDDAAAIVHDDDVARKHDASGGDVDLDSATWLLLL
jgi:hypothetical protein